MMKVKLKPAKRIILLFSFLLIFVPFQISAETDSSGNGELKLKVDRIIEDKDETMQQTETELEKVFPALFAEETETKIEDEELEQEEALEEIQQSLFSMGAADTNVTLQNVKQSLFTNDYTVTAQEAGQNQEDEEKNGLSNTFLITLTGIACVLCAGIYMMMRRMLE